MQKSNQDVAQEMLELIKKGVIDTSSLATGGLLNPQQAKEFIDFVIDITNLKGKVRIARLKGQQTDIDKIQVGKRVAVPKAEGVDPGIRRGVTTSKVSLRPEVIMVPFEISDEFGWDNIEGEEVETRIVRMMATQFANDLEELAFLGNKLGPAVIEAEIVEGGSPVNVVKDSYLALQDGYLELASQGHVVDHNGSDIDSALFTAMVNAMPPKFKRNKRNLKFFCSTEHEQLYRQRTSDRATGAGDVALSTTQNLTPFGYDLVPFPLLPAEPTMTEHVQLNGVITVPLKHSNLSSMIVSVDTLGSTAVAPLIEGTDYTEDLVNGTITRIGGAIGDGDTVKVSYVTQGQLMFTEYRNLIWGIGLDIRIEQDRSIYKGVNEFALTARIAVAIEETDAVVYAKNVSLS